MSTPAFDKPVPDETTPASLQATRNAFGTFGGVFTPSILTILGVILFMRANFVVGQAGIFHAILILLVAKSITLLTSLSIGAISTNMQVRGGGAYYMISRVLGPEFGGAIGVALFFALALSVPFYLIGFTEALTSSRPELQPHFLFIALGAGVIFFVIAYASAGAAIKTQYIILSILVLAILTFLLGALQHFDLATFRANWKSLPTEKAPPGTRDLTFWAIFAIYFPAVTGIDAGVNMSGDLKDPGRSIPRGTLAAVGVGFLVYLGQILICGGAFPRTGADGMNLLEEPFLLLRENALFGFGILVSLGVYAATLSSALGSYLAAPRVLQAVSRDPILPFLKFFGKGTLKGDEPRRALLLVGVITFVVLLWAGGTHHPPGETPPAPTTTSETEVKAAEPPDALNAVAAVITMFFLFSYGTINAAAFLEARGDNPSFRPRFRLFHWSTALTGALGCIATALLINATAAIVAATLIALLVWQVRRRSLEVTFGDARRGYVYAQARRDLLTLAAMEEDARNWRPTILVFSGNPNSREALVSYAVWLEAGRGIVFLANILVGDLKSAVPRRPAALRQLRDFCREKRIHAFPDVVIAPNLESGVRILLQTAGIDSLRPNVAVFGWTTGDYPEHRRAFVSHLHLAAAMGISLVLLGNLSLPEIDEPKRIDLWWRGEENGALMILLAYLLRRNWEWADAEIRVLRVVAEEVGRQPAQDALDALILDARVEATPRILVSQRPFPEILQTHSADATCVFLGFDIPETDHAERWHAQYIQLMENMPTTILVHSQAGPELLE